MLTARSPTAGRASKFILGIGLNPYQTRSDGGGGMLIDRHPSILDTLTINRISVLETPSIALRTYVNSAAYEP